MAPRTKAQQREDTTRLLLAVARGLFEEKGFAQVSMAEIVGAARVSKGALYHYFASKDELFRAVLAEVHAEVAGRVAAVPAADPWAALVEGCRVFVTATTEPRVQRILLIDAPAVLGWDTWRELDASASMRHLIDILETLVADGTIPPQPVVPVAHLLSGAMNEAAAWLATSADPERDLADTLAALTRLLESLRLPLRAGHAAG